METQNLKYKYLKVVLKWSVNDLMHGMDHLSLTYSTGTHSLVVLVLAFSASFFHVEHSHT